MNKSLRDQIYFPAEEYTKEIPVTLRPQEETFFSFTPDTPVAIDCIEWTNHSDVRLVRLMLGNTIYYDEGLISFTRRLIDPGFVVQGRLHNSSDSEIQSVVIIHGRTLNLEPLNELRARVRDFLGRMSSL